MAKKKRNVSAQDADVPLSAMIDVVFLLLIYFILTQKPIIEESFLSVNLPSPNPGKSTDEKKPEIMTIDVFKLEKNSDDYYHVNKQRMHITALKDYLRSVAEFNPETQLIITCGPNAKHRKLVNLLDICNELKLYNINLLNDDSILFVPEH